MKVAVRPCKSSSRVVGQLLHQRGGSWFSSALPDCSPGAIVFCSHAPALVTNHAKNQINGNMTTNNEIAQGDSWAEKGSTNANATTIATAITNALATGCFVMAT
jgi:hypothetical protein